MGCTTRRVFTAKHAPGLLDHVLRPGRRNSAARPPTRNMNHVAHANEKVRAGVERYLQKVGNDRVRKRREGECLAHTRAAGNSFSAGRPRKCGENVVAAASVAKIYYSVTLQAHSGGERDREKTRNVAYTVGVLLYCFLRARIPLRVTAYFKYGFAHSSFGLKTLYAGCKERADGRGWNRDIFMYLLRGFPDGRIPAVPASVRESCNVFVSFRRAFLKPSFSPRARSASLPFQVHSELNSMLRGPENLLLFSWIVPRVTTSTPGGIVPKRECRIFGVEREQDLCHAVARKKISVCMRRVSQRIEEGQKKGKTETRRTARTESEQGREEGDTMMEDRREVGRPRKDEQTKCIRISLASVKTSDGAPLEIFLVVAYPIPPPVVAGRFIARDFATPPYAGDRSKRTQRHRRAGPILKEFGRKPGLSYDGRGLLSVHSPHPPFPFPYLTGCHRMPLADTHRKNRNQFLLAPRPLLFLLLNLSDGGHAVLEEEKKVVGHTGEKPYTKKLRLELRNNGTRQSKARRYRGGKKHKAGEIKRIRGLLKSGLRCLSIYVSPVRYTPRRRQILLCRRDDLSATGTRKKRRRPIAPWVYAQDKTSGILTSTSVPVAPISQPEMTRHLLERQNVEEGERSVSMNETYNRRLHILSLGFRRSMDRSCSRSQSGAIMDAVPVCLENQRWGNTSGNSVRK
ncbi:hypothetical protein DBV15_06749 [Temnothorax longispinosus]|uniref:Uncharacterized protein n=1 Tax=Temnothorax longispinosus TaxID=300112 RepID=A0A4S2JR81_9HYME|nr:hypothetical protein DBV15_06749 [Temnothorax longispinosus]